MFSAFVIITFSVSEVLVALIYGYIRLYDNVGRVSLQLVGACEMDARTFRDLVIVKVEISRFVSDL